MSVGKSYVLNKNFREPYVHYTKAEYQEQSPNISGMKMDALSVYKSQSKKLADRFRQNEMPQGTEKEAGDAMKTIDAALKGFLNTSAFKEQVENINVFKDEMYKIEGKSFWSYSQSKEKRDELFEDADMLANFVQNLGASLETFRKTSKEERDRIMGALEARRVNVPTKDALSSVSIIKGDSKADIGLKKIIASVELLERYSDPLNRKYGNKADVPLIKEEEAKEIVRALAGSLNGLKGGFFEIAVNELGNNMTTEVMEEINNLSKLSRGTISITGTGMAGTKMVESSATLKKIVSKTDINMMMSIDKSGADMNIGLSLKTSTVDDKTGYRKTTIVSKANYGDLLKRAGAIVDESSYHIANIAAGNGSTGSAVYKAAKMKTSALLALEALSGLGNKADTAYYVMYTDKVLNISTFLDQIGKGNELPLTVNLEGIKGLGSTITAKKREYLVVDRYIRSRECLKLIHDTIKVTMSSMSKG